MDWPNREARQGRHFWLRRRGGSCWILEAKRRHVRYGFLNPTHSGEIMEPRWKRRGFFVDHFARILLLRGLCSTSASPSSSSTGGT